jgi:hypothetical protein
MAKSTGLEIGDKMLWRNNVNRDIGVLYAMFCHNRWMYDYEYSHGKKDVVLTITGLTTTLIVARNEEGTRRHTFTRRAFNSCPNLSKL